MLAGRSRRSLVNLNNGNKPFIGRRTGKVIDIKARLDKFGFERVSDYFPDTDSESDDEILHNPSINDENIDSSKLNKSKHNASSRSTEQNKSRNEPESERSQNKSEISPDSAVGSTDSEIPDANEVEHVSPQEKLVCLPDKKVRSPEKPVSSPEKQVSSPEKPVSSPEKQVSSPEQLVTLPDKPASPSNKQVLSTVKRDRAIPQANISGFSITASSSEEEDMNPESTKKKLRFSLCNTSFVREELRSDIEQCLITSNGVNEPSEDDYVITDSARNARTKTLTTTVKNAKQKRKSQESSEDIEEQLTQKICKSDPDKFLTLKKRPNNTIREMLYRSKNHSKITIPPESPQLSSNNAAVSTSPQPSPKDETVRSQKCDENENKVSTTAPTTQKANRSKIPVRRKKTAKPTFQLRSSRKSSPKTQRYRKTPAAKSGARKTGDAEPEHTDERDERGIDLDSGDASDAGTSTLQAANSSKKSTTNEKLSNTRPESQTIKTSLGKRSTRSTKQQEFIQIEVTDSEESDDNPKEITTKIPRSKKNARVSDLTESSNVEVAGLQSKSPDKSASMLDSSASQRVQSLASSVEESGSFRRSSRKRTGLSNQNELECGVNFESTVKTPISSRTSTTKNTDTNSERSSRNSSEDESTASGVEVFHNTTEGPESTINSEDDGGESTIKAPRHRKKRVLKLDSATATINMEVDDNVGVGLRRSKRNRVPCLQYWKNDRIEYERRQSGFVVKDIIVNPTPAPTRRRKGFYGQPIKSQSKKATGDRNSTEDESDWSDIEMPDGMTKQTDPVATVVDLDTKHEVEMKLFHSGKNLDLRSPTSTQDESSTIDAPLLLDKYFTQGKFGAGEILLRPGAEKGMQHVRRDTMIFRLLSGRVLFSIHNQSFVASKGSTFFVPQGNIYNLKNLDSKKDARLSFYQIKE